MKTCSILHVLVAAVCVASGCHHTGWGLDLDVERACLTMVDKLTVTVVLTPPRTADPALLDGASFFAGKHHVVVLPPDGTTEVAVHAAASDGQGNLVGTGELAVPVAGAELVERTLTVAGPGCPTDGGAGDAARPPFCPGGKCVFVTSATFNGNLGGLAGADARCQAAADAVGVRGTYRAWLSTNTVAARDRLTHATVPYYLIDGTLVANSWADLVGGGPRHAISVSEKNTAPPNANVCVGGYSVWTATHVSGAQSVPGADVFCGEWNSTGNGATVGSSMSTGMYWTYKCNLAAGGCGMAASLYCFEQ
jgi:hypothetical protein